MHSDNPSTRHNLTWSTAVLSILILTALLRLYDLNLSPLHHDEGVNGFFLTRLYSQGHYEYDPSNYHGPTLYYAALITSSLFGPSTVAIRIVPALFGVATVWLTTRLKRYMGEPAALSVAALLAVSPGAVYFSRYFIHEALFVFLTIALAVSIIEYRNTRQRLYFFGASACAGLLYATKETAVLSVVVLVLAIGVTKLYSRIPFIRRLRSVRDESLPGRRLKLGEIIAAVLILAGVAGLFFSSFLRHPAGVVGALSSLNFWARTGSSQHVHPWYQYLVWLAREEWPILALSLIGFWVIGRLRASVEIIFVGAWTVGILVTYSLIPYKTPWLTLNILVPLTIIAGYGVGRLHERGFSRIALLVSIAAISASGYKTIRLNLFEFDNSERSYVYAHTERAIFALLHRIDLIASRNGADISMAILSPDYWPLPWYLRNYSNVGYWGRPIETTASIVICSEAQEDQVRPALESRYERVGSYHIRPGLDLVLYVDQVITGSER